MYNFNIYFYIFDFFALPVCFLNINLMLYIYIYILGGIQLYTERLIASSPPKMIFNIKKSYIPNYEGRAIAFIIVVLKTLLGLDGITEYYISRIAEKINRYV